MTSESGKGPGLFDIEGPHNHRLTVRLHGQWEVEVAERLQKALAEVLRPEARHLLVTVDLRGLENVSVSARSVLVDVQRRISQHARRTAYLSDRPRFRGLALWIVHLAADGNACSALSEAQAQAWLDSAPLRG